MNVLVLFAADLPEAAAVAADATLVRTFRDAPIDRMHCSVGGS